MGFENNFIGTFYTILTKTLERQISEQKKRIQELEEENIKTNLIIKLLEINVPQTEL